jgi:NAD(P)-dependent dehydrogenase (short-subunit alcohol dehydrogenase family)
VIALLGAGFTVYGTSRKVAAGETRGGVVFLPLDVTDDVSVAGAVREVLERSGRIDVLVNNAGVGSSVPARRAPSPRTGLSSTSTSSASCG